MDLFPAEVKPYLNFIHPLLMWILFGLCIYAMYLGIQIRRTRSVDAATRKDLIKGKFNDRHHKIGSIILALMVLGSMGALAVTYINNGKLFLGPHLVAGLSMTVMIAVSAALTPYMQKGKDWARYGHISINIGIVGLFGWQAFSGIEILQRIISKM
jgi:MFS family permease